MVKLILARDNRSRQSLAAHRNTPSAVVLVPLVRQVAALVEQALQELATGVEAAERQLRATVAQAALVPHLAAAVAVAAQHELDQHLEQAERAVMPE